MYYANHIGPEDTGRYIFAVSFATIFGILVDLGFSPVLIREISRHRDQAQQILSNVLRIKLGFAAITALGVAVTVHYLGYPLVTQELIWMALIVMVAESFSLTLYGTLRGFQNLQYEAVGSILYQVIAMAVGFIGLQLTDNVLVLGVAVVIGALTNLGFAFYNVKRRLGLAFRPRLEELSVRTLIKTSIPFFIAGVFTKVYAYIDIVLLSLIKGDVYVGWYSVAYKLTYALQFLPIAFSNAVYPVFSQHFIDSQEQLTHTLYRSLKYVLLISLPVAIGAAVLAHPIVHTLWPSFVDAVPALRIGVIGLVFVFANFILSSFLNACNRQKTNTINIGLTMGVNVVLNIILIPAYAHIGAAVSAASSALFLFVINIYWVRKIVSMQTSRIVRFSTKATLSAAVMGLAVHYLPGSLFLAMGIGGIVYLAAVLGTRAVTIADIQTLWNSLIRKKTAPNEPAPSKNF